jgi:hypothetical protein
MQASPFVGRLLPGLPEHLAAFGSRPPADTEDILYWSKEKFGLTPFITVTHTIIAPEVASRYVIAARDVYSSRYIDASLSITIASDTPSGFSLVFVNRSIANALKGALAGLRRSIAQRRMRGSVEDNLRRVKRQIESEEVRK